MRKKLSKVEYDKLVEAAKVVNKTKLVCDEKTKAPALSDKVEKIMALLDAVDMDAYWEGYDDAIVDTIEWLRGKNVPDVNLEYWTLVDELRKCKKEKGIIGD